MSAAPIIRKARKAGVCANARAFDAGNAPGCKVNIAPGERYMEGENNGSAGGFGKHRICMACYERDYAKTPKPDANWQQACKEICATPLSEIRGDLFQAVKRRAAELAARGDE